jgi:UDP-N-acetyl-alpha-D-muramoyl-L-alanyl-L-glutamate epimerase
MKSAMGDAPVVKQRADFFRYVSLEIDESTLLATYELDGRRFVEAVTYEGVLLEDNPAVTALARLWFLLAGLSYYKAGAARQIDLGSTPIGPKGRALLKAALREGLGEFAYKNDLSLDDVTIVGGTEVVSVDGRFDPQRVLVPFGGGIDSVVTTSQLSPDVDQALFVVSPPHGRFAPLEATAECTGLHIVRATRSLDPQILSPDPSFFQGHVPVTAMVTLLAAIAAAATQRGGVVMSNEHSSSASNLRWNDLDVNHQWSKSFVAEIVIAEAIDESVGGGLVVASFLRDRSEVWVAEVFSHLTKYHHVFRSCNRAFSQVTEERLDTWCGECDKCLFINLMLAPYLPRATLREIFHHEPLSDPARDEQLRVLVGAGSSFKPFECVGDPDESAVALDKVTQLDEWRDIDRLESLAREVGPDRSFEELLESQGPSRVPAHWLR